jgi:integrase
MGVIDDRVSTEGKVSYRARVRLKGYPPQVATFSRKTDAKKWIQDTESAIREGRYFKSAEAKKHTFGEMIDRYVRDVIPTRGKGREKQTALVIWWKGELGTYTLADVTSAMIAECRDSLLREDTYRKTKRSPATVVRYLAALSHVYSTAVNEWEWIENNPIRRVRKPTEPRGRVRFLSEQERRDLLHACQGSENRFLYPIVVLAISTGMRSGEILNLTGVDVDLKRGQIVLHETKNNERRAVPISGLALELLQNLTKGREQDNKLLFPGNDPKKPIDFRSAWIYALKKAQIENFRFHDLRHTAASYLAMNGATLAEIAEVLGHKTLAMVKRYSHMSDAHTAGVVERMNDKIFGGGT